MRILASVRPPRRFGGGVSEERLRREKGWGDDVPWLAVDEVLGIAGWSRFDVDAIATIRGIFPLHYFRFSPMRELYYTAKKTLDRSDAVYTRAMAPQIVENISVAPQMTDEMAQVR
jgi:hypothetical protein